MLDALHRDVTWATLEQGMRGLTEQKKAIAENVANSLTPGYKRREVDFVNGLREALESGGRRESVSKTLRGTESQSFEIINEEFRNDGNGVDIMREMTLLARTSVDKAMNLSLMQKKIRMYKSVLRDGR